MSSGEQTSKRKFRSLVAFVVVSGTLLVGFVWDQRQYEHPTTLDSWQNAYAVYDCQAETWLEPFDSAANPDGIRSRGDGIIYIEPASDAVAGDNATLEVFLDSVGAQLTDDQLTLPDGTTLSEQNSTCDDQDAVLQVRRWPEGAEQPIETRITDLANTNFLANGESLAIVLAPATASIPIPPSSADLPPERTTSVAAGLDG